MAVDLLFALFFKDIKGSAALAAHIYPYHSLIMEYGAQKYLYWTDKNSENCIIMYYNAIFVNIC